MVKNILNIIFGIALIVKASSCCEERDDLPVHKLSSSDLQWTTPYQVGQVFRFRNDQGSERAYSVDSVTLENYDDGIGGEHFQCATYKYDVWRAWMHKLGDTLHRRSIFEIAIPDSIEDSYMELDWDFQVSIPIYEFETNPSLIQGTNSKIIDQLEVSGKSYVNVLYFETWRSIDSTSTQIQTMFYSKEHGVIRFDLMNGEKWQRQ